MKLGWVVCLISLFSTLAVFSLLTAVYVSATDTGTGDRRHQSPLSRDTHWVALGKWQNLHVTDLTGWLEG